ncbi:MAG: hypothetical protein NVS4B1_19430 [Ktedonobacteraceae bacterium]
MYTQPTMMVNVLSFESAELYFSSSTSGAPETQMVTLIQENGTWEIDTVTNS